jgi:hypothetical protein
MQPEPITASGRSAPATYRAMLTSRFGQHGVDASGSECRCGAARPCDEERHIALLLEMDIGDEACSGPPPAAQNVTDTWPRHGQLTGPTGPGGPVRTERRTGGVTSTAAGPAASPGRPT